MPALTKRKRAAKKSWNYKRKSSSAKRPKRLKKWSDGTSTMAVTSPTGASKVATPTGTSTMAVTSPTAWYVCVCMYSSLFSVVYSSITLFFSIISLCSTVHVQLQMYMSKRSIVGHINYSDTNFERTVIATDFGLAPGCSPTLTHSANRR